MTEIEIYLQYASNIKDRFLPAESFEHADHTFSTSDFVQEIEAHYGSLGDDKKVNLLVAQLNQFGFIPKMVPGNINMVWLLCDKK